MIAWGCFWTDRYQITYGSRQPCIEAVIPHELLHWYYYQVKDDTSADPAHEKPLWEKVIYPTQEKILSELCGIE